MKLIPNVRREIRRLWSFKLAILSALFGVLEQVLPALGGFIPPGVFAILSVVTALWGAGARLVVQKP